MRPPETTPLLQIGAHQIDQIFSQFGCNLLFGPIHQVEADVRLQHLAHQTVHSASNCRQQHQLTATVVIGRHQPFNCIQLAPQSAHSLQQFQLFPLVNTHNSPLLDNTHPRYSIYRVGV